MVASFVVGYLDMPGFWQHVNLLSVYALNVAEVRITELEVVEGELHTDEVQGEVERGKLAVVGRRLCAVDESAE